LSCTKKNLILQTPTIHKKLKQLGVPCLQLTKRLKSLGVKKQIFMVKQVRSC